LGAWPRIASPSPSLAFQLDLQTANGLNNLKETIGPSPIFVKFYPEKCGHCKAMAEDFADAAATFGTNVTFGGVECRENKKICDSYQVKGFPTIKLFLAGQKKGIEFTGTRSVDGFCDFIENSTTFRALRPPRYTVDLHPLNFDETVNNTKCLFVTFYAPWCRHCRGSRNEEQREAGSQLIEQRIYLFETCS
jgi:protein disulfide-isomerase A6